MASKSRELPVSAKTLQVFAKPVFEVLAVAIPFAITSTRRAHGIFQKLPQNALLFCYGAVFCFFGGTFPTLFAALQAAEHGGRKKVMVALTALSDEALAIIAENKKDDDEDANNDGKSDAKELSPAEFVARKSKLVLRKINPDKIDEAISSMYTVWLSVAAVLSIKFARTISMALSIADFLVKPIDRFVTPTLNLVIPDEYEKWVPVVIAWVIKGVAMSIAWYIQAVMSAFTSALAGGLMMAHSTHKFCVDREYKLLGWIPDDHTKSSVDEFLSYIFAGLGFFFQFKHHFTLPFPLNLVLWPFQLAEYYIKWTITSKNIA